LASTARARKTNQAPSETVKIKGTIARVKYHKEDTGFTIMGFEMAEGLFTTKGTMTGVREGDEFELTGYWVNDPQWA
jgi:hypothetical protein